EPGSGAGNTVIAAHIDSPDYPIGPFASLRDAPAGAEVRVVSAAGVETRWAVQTVTFFAKTDLDTDALFARTGPATLVLVTCGGEFDPSTGHYRDNVVLVATPVS
ncbi:class F sortase, partial [uncultured Sphingomonas sp.]|uniref:class F sortase n=1 Tax=uncultured Sphingomonas sp. TaxID=158754 RepID=UPI0025F3C87F